MLPSSKTAISSGQKNIALGSGSDQEESKCHFPNIWFTGVHHLQKTKLLHVRAFLFLSLIYTSEVSEFLVQNCIAWTKNKPIHQRFEKNPAKPILCTAKSCFFMGITKEINGSSTFYQGNCTVMYGWARKILKWTP